MSTSHTARAGRHQTARSTLLMYVVHLGRLKAPRKAAGQMDLLTVPSADGVDSKVIQVEEALSATAKAFSIPQRQTRMPIILYPTREWQRKAIFCPSRPHWLWGSRRSRAAAFGDNTPDDIFASAGRPPGRATLEAEGVSTSSSATTVGDGGE